MMRCAAVFLIFSTTILPQTLAQGQCTPSYDNKDSFVLAVGGEEATMKFTFDRTVKNFPKSFKVKVVHKRFRDGKENEMFLSMAEPKSYSKKIGMSMRLSTSNYTVTVVGTATKAALRHDGNFTCTIVPQDSSSETTFGTTQELRLIVVMIDGIVLLSESGKTNTYTFQDLLSKNFQEGRPSGGCMLTSSDKEVNAGLYMIFRTVDHSDMAEISNEKVGKFYIRKMAGGIPMFELPGGVRPNMECGARYRGQEVKRRISVRCCSDQSTDGAEKGRQDGREISHDAAESGLDFAMSGSSQNGLKAGSDYLLVSLGTLVLCVARALWQG